MGFFSTILEKLGMGSAGAAAPTTAPTPTAAPAVVRKNRSLDA